MAGPDPALSSPEVGESSWLSPLGLSDFVAIRLGTSGLDPAVHRILEVGAVRFQEGRPVAEFSSLVRFAEPLSPFITDLTGITEPELRQAPPLAAVVPRLRDFLGDWPLVSQNSEFDLAFLRQAGEAEQSEAEAGFWTFSGTAVVDVALLARVFWPEHPGFTTAALAGTFGVPLAPVHRAAEDARATGELLVRMIERLPSRVWRELASALYQLIEGSSHRSRSFFALLRRLAAAIPKPEPSPVEAAPEDDAPPVPSLADLFGHDGHFEHHLPFFRFRPMQLALAQAAEEAFEREQVLLAEAPTGVGKSLAYLAAALRWVLADPEAARQVIISSHTKVLQDQLCRKDIAELHRAVGGGFRAAVLKGRANYLCRRRLRLLLREAPERLTESERLHLMPLVRWAETTSTGDIAEIHAFSPRALPFLWAQIASDPQVCSGTGCNTSKGDFYRAAQERAAKSDIVFVNHALLLSDLSRFTGGARRLVLDEAHQIERAMVGAMTAEISAPPLRNTLSRLVDERGSRGLLPTVMGRLLKGHPGGELLTARDLITRLRTLHLTVRQSFAALAERLVLMLDSGERSGKFRFRSGQRLHTQIGAALAPLLVQWNEPVTALRGLLQQLGGLRGDSKLSSDLLVEFRSAIDGMEEAGAQLAGILRESDPNAVTWVEFGRSAHSTWCALFAAPVSVGAIMERAFWPSVQGAVLTSATLTAAGEFTVLKESLGLVSRPPEQVRELTLGSPFRLEQQMRTFVPLYLPEPRQGGVAYAEALSELLRRLIERFPRGTLILSTSNDLAERLTSSLAPVARRMGRRLLSQGSSASLADLVAEFRRRGDAILIGAASFWEGIDVVGDALQILLVTRIPFDVPSEPWVAARTEALQNAGHDAFAAYSLPVAALRLKQGVGRLIRHPSDRGVAIIADSRLFKSRYGGLIRSSLPSSPRAIYDEDALFVEMERFFQADVT